MIEVRRYSAGEEEALRQICIETTLLVNVEEYGSELVHKWVKRLGDIEAWKKHVRTKNPLVAVTDEAIIGFAEFDPGGKIGAFYSHHAWQRRGVGTALLDRIEQEAESLGIGSIRVDSSLSASRFFEARGFAAIRENEVFTDGVPSRSVALVKATDGRRRQPGGPAPGL